MPNGNTFTRSFLKASYAALFGLGALVLVNGWAKLDMINETFLAIVCFAISLGAAWIVLMVKPTEDFLARHARRLLGWFTFAFAVLMISKLPVFTSLPEILKTGTTLAWLASFVMLAINGYAFLKQAKAS